VHSMKDVPVTLPEGTVLPSTLQREDTSDVFISKKHRSVRSLPAGTEISYLLIFSCIHWFVVGSVIGSASLRRQAQLLALNPNIKVVNFRGNVQTRLQKIENGVVDGTLLALAGLRRLGMNSIISSAEIIGWDVMLPAVAQGSIGLHCRSTDSKSLEYVMALNHQQSTVCVECERSFLRTLDGNCRTPIAGQATVKDGKIHFQGLICKPSGHDMKRVTRIGRMEDSVALGIEAGEDIKAQIGGNLEAYGIRRL
jgi:hydroxymethylbilane synthase